MRDLGLFIGRAAAFFGLGVLFVFYEAANGVPLFTFTFSGYAVGSISVGINYSVFVGLLLVPLGLELIGSGMAVWAQREMASPVWGEVVGEQLALRGFPFTRLRGAVLTQEEKDYIEEVEEEEGSYSTARISTRPRRK